MSNLEHWDLICQKNVKLGEREFHKQGAASPVFIIIRPKENLTRFLSRLSCLLLKHLQFPGMRLILMSCLLCHTSSLLHQLFHGAFHPKWPYSSSKAVPVSLHPPFPRPTLTKTTLDTTPCPILNQLAVAQPSYDIWMFVQ